MYLATMRALNPRALNVHVRCMVKLYTAEIVTAITDSNVRFPSVHRTRERSAYTPALIPSDVPPTTPNLNKFHTSLQRNSHVTFFSLRNLRIRAESVAGRRLTRPLVVDAEVGVTGRTPGRRHGLGRFQVLERDGGPPGGAESRDVKDTAPERPAHHERRRPRRRRREPRERPGSARGRAGRGRGGGPAA